MSNPVVAFDNQKHLDVPAQDHKAYLEILQMVIKASIRGSTTISTLDEGDILYILRHRSHLPDDMISTLKEAVEKGETIDTEMALDVLTDLATREHIPLDSGQLAPFWEVFRGNIEAGMQQSDII
jgi:hypothetical protein